MASNKKIEVQNTSVTISNIAEEDYICITDMAKAKQIMLELLML